MAKQVFISYDNQDEYAANELKKWLESVYQKATLSIINDSTDQFTQPKSNSILAIHQR